MGSSERTDYFERLVDMRIRYQADREPVGSLSIDDAMIYAEAVMEASVYDDEPWVVEAESVANDAADDLIGAALAAGPRTTLCTVDELRTALERWPDVAGSAGAPHPRADHAAD